MNKIWFVPFGHKTNLISYRVLKIIQTIFSESKRIKLLINSRKLSGKSSNISKLNSAIPNNLRMKEEITMEIKYFKLNDNENISN